MSRNTKPLSGDLKLCYTILKMYADRKYFACIVYTKFQFGYIQELWKIAFTRGYNSILLFKFIYLMLRDGIYAVNKPFSFETIFKSLSKKRVQKGTDDLSGPLERWLVLLTTKLNVVDAIPNQDKMFVRCSRGICVFVLMSNYTSVPFKNIMNISLLAFDSEVH